MKKKKDSEKDDFIFSPELRKELSGFGDMDVKDCLRSEDFMRTLCKFGGMSDEEFDKILNRNK